VLTPLFNPYNAYRQKVSVDELRSLPSGLHLASEPDPIVPESLVGFESGCEARGTTVAQDRNIR